jgi:predicted nucleotidyltransferase
MEAKTRKLAQELKALIKDRFGEADVIVFGSRARGDFQPESDLDICVIVERLDRKTRDVIFDCAWEVGFKAGMVIVPVIFNRKEWKGVMASAPIVKTIAKEGVRL